MRAIAFGAASREKCRVTSVSVEAAGKSTERGSESNAGARRGVNREIWVGHRSGIPQGRRLKKEFLGRYAGLPNRKDPLAI